jgi:uncharacterized Fe-S cluster protein YjdI
MKKEYTLGDLTVLWQPDLCIHSGECVRRLPNVFRPKERPWVKMEGSDEQTIREVVSHCPSHALTIMEKEIPPVPPPVTEEPETNWHHVSVLENGPLRVQAACRIVMPDGSIVEKLNGVSLCRCGASSKKPFCDGSHRQIAFAG